MKIAEFKYSDESEVILAETNCTDVSAVRAMHSTVGGFDFGLVIFFILNGQLFYRQLIDDEWTDAEIVSIGPNGVTWKEIAAFRTWDYRIGVQAKSASGDIYELFTQFMGIGKQNVEHIQVDVKPKVKHVTIDYADTKDDEHIKTAVTISGMRTYGLSSVPISVRNVNDGTGNYGTTIRVELDHPVTNVEGNSANFFLKDGNDAAYVCYGCRGSSDGKTLILTFMDFNLAEGSTLTIEYVPGTIMSPAVAMNAFAFTFVPENLVAPNIPIPEPIEAWNLNAEGTEVALRFSQSLVGDITGYETPVAYIQKSIDLSSATITALNSYSATNNSAKVADGDTSTYWRGTTAVNWIKFQLVEAKTITSVRMYMGSYYIQTFTVSGSNDGETWTQLGGEYTAATSSTSKWYDISIENTEPYLYYRIDTLTTYSSTVYLYEVELCETVPIGNETRFSVTGQTYDYVPDGELESTSHIVLEVSEDPDDDAVIRLKFADGNIKSLRNAVGNVAIAYSGGTLRGLGGPVADFIFEFAPAGLEPKHHPNVSDHVETEVGVDATLTRVYYTDLSESEHIEAVVALIGNLIHVDDI